MDDQIHKNDTSAFDLSDDMDSDDVKEISSEENSSDGDNEDEIYMLESQDEDDDYVFVQKNSSDAYEEEIPMLELQEYEGGDDIDKYQSHNFRTVGNVDDNDYPFPPDMKKRKVMELKDIVKDNALAFLPAKALCRLKLVSKDWNNRISGPLLALHQSYRFRDLSGFFVHYGPYTTFVTLNRPCCGVPTPSLRFLPEPGGVKILGSCNGLLLLGFVEGGFNTYYVCNPATEEYKVIPEPSYYHGSKPAIVLAFEPSALNMEADYHLVCAVPLIDQPIVCFEIYSSRTGTWTLSDTTCVGLEDSNFAGYDGHYSKGVCYWVTDTRKVLAFDIKDKVYGIISLPMESPQHGILSHIRGELSYVCITRGEADDQYCISIYGGISDMGLRLRIDLRLEPVNGAGRGYRVLPSTDGDEIMILTGKTIYRYDLRDQRVGVICNDGVEDSVEGVRYLPYVNSLVRVA